VQNLDLLLASGESSLSIRSFSIEQRMSALFEVTLVALSPEDDLDLHALLGSGAALRLGASDAGPASFRAWSGIVSHAEQLDIDHAGVASYLLRIVPTLWRTTRRRNSRIFQHRSLPEIAVAVLAEWGIEPALELDLTTFPRLEYRVQYGETDFAFLSRILEEAGVAYTFRDPDPDADDAHTTLVLSTDAHRNEARERGPLLYVGARESNHKRDTVSHVRFAEDVRSGRLTVRDYDFRSRPDFQLLAEARASAQLEERFELYDYAPGAFLIEPEGARGARVDEKHARALVHRSLDAVRQGKRAVTFQANVLDLAPGAVFTMTGHPRRELGDDARLLTVHQKLEGTRDSQWTITGHAVLADEAYRPAQVTPKPRIPGVQSAIVVGPPGEEIHTDEHGRVRVQFHWDREGKRDQHSSCFLRVSQSWASRGYGAQAIPRVGDEVLVGFFEGDPDQPVIVGRVHNSAARVPYALPANKTRSTWRSESTPGGDGWNEIMFEDQKGRELLAIHAEKDLSRVVNESETTTIGASLSTSIGAGETRQVAADQTVRVGGSRSARVEGTETISVGEALNLDLGGGTGATITKDKRIVFTTGQASIVLDGPNIYLDGEACVRISGGDLVAVAGGEVHLDGGPNVYLNAAPASPPGVTSLDDAAELLEGFELPETEEEQLFSRLLSMPVEEPDAAPEALVLPAHVDKQLTAQRNQALAGLEQLEATVLDKVELAKKKLKDLGENLVPKVEKARAEINTYVDSLRAQIEKVKAEAAARLAELKAQAKALWAPIQARIDLAKEMVARARQAYEAVKERIDEATAQVRKLVADIKQRITDVKNDVKARFDDLRKRALAVRDEAKHIVDEVKAAIQHAKDQWKQVVTDVKTTIADAKQHLKNIVADLKNHNLSLKEKLQAAFGEGKALVGDAKKDVAKVGADAHAIVTDAKTEAAQIKQDAGKVVTDTKALGKEAVKDAKDTVAEVKGKAKDTADEIKSTAADLKNDAKGAAGDVKSAATDLKNDAKQLFSGAPDPGKGGGDVVAFAHKGQLPAGGGGLSLPGGALPGTLPGAGTPAAGAAAAGGASAAARSPASAIVTRPGGFGGDSVARAVNGTEGATFLQSPNEGQLMVLRTRASVPISPSVLTSHVVEHQMEGMPSSDAFAAVLKEHGYAVYERPWESASGEFLQKAVL
jgi:type VI secretion system secreted protein VgrG